MSPEMTLTRWSLRTESKLHLLRTRTVCKRALQSTRARSYITRGRSKTQTPSSAACASCRRPSRISRSPSIGFVHCHSCSPSTRMMCSGWRMRSSRAIMMATGCCMSLCTTTRRSRSTSRVTSLIRRAASGGLPTIALKPSSPKIPTLPYSPARCFM